MNDDLFAAHFLLRKMQEDEWGTHGSIHIQRFPQLITISMSLSHASLAHIRSTFCRCLFLFLEKNDPFLCFLKESGCMLLCI